LAGSGKPGDCLKVIIAGGGTGGHIFPAIAIAEALKADFPEAIIHFVGTRYGMETELVPRAGYPLLTLPIRGFLGKGISEKLALLWRLPASLLISLCLIARYRPKVVIGVGGYASGPLLLVAALLRIPTLIQEQNAFPGITNRLASRVARVALCGFAEAAKWLKCPVIVTGNPVRNSLGAALPWSPERKQILILGGSQGARSLNRILPQLLRETLGEDAPKVVHQCGSRYSEEVKASYEGAAFEVEVTPFIDNIGDAMNRSLMLICRAGAGTIAELAQMRVPAILVPFPQAAHDHQTYNARSLAKSGAVRLLPESQFEQLADEMRELLDQRELLGKMASAYPPLVGNAAVRCAKIAAGLILGKEVGDLDKEFGTHV